MADFGGQVVANVYDSRHSPVLGLLLLACGHVVANIPPVRGCVLAQKYTPTKCRRFLARRLRIFQGLRQFGGAGRLAWPLSQTLGNAAQSLHKSWPLLYSVKFSLESSFEMSGLLTAKPPSSHAADEQLAIRVKHQLKTVTRAFSQLAVEVESGVVTLRGVATSFYQKQLWLHGAKRVAGDVARIKDEIDVTSKWEATDFGWRD